MTHMPRMQQYRQRFPNLVKRLELSIYHGLGNGC